ncbi:MAG: TldD/PmbA family protein [Ruminococcaceae bacterium]|jgi:PmbA protein|nr:TldD/PmbA family protein [Oscillospiraceae bacterium]
MDKLEQLAELILNEAKARGAESAQCVVKEKETHEFNLDGGEFSLMRTLFDRSVRLSVLKGARKGTASINSFEPDALRALAEDCVASAESAEPDEAWEFDAVPRDESFTDGALTCDAEALFARTKELADDVAARHPKIILEQMITEHEAARSVYKNTAGVTVRTESGCYEVSLDYSGHEGEKSTSFFFGGARLASLDKRFIDCALIERELTAVENQLDPVPLEGKFTGTVLLAPGALDELILSPVYENFVSDSCLIDGTSIWKDKLGEQVADERFSLSFTPRAEDVVCGARYTGEGYPAEDGDLIRDGKLVSFALSQYGANKTGGVRARCDSWNPRIPAGDKTLDEIIAGIERGVLVMRFSGGEPAASGEFSGVAKNSFLIKNGRLAGALSETMISGCIPDMLMHIRAISSDVLRDGSCSQPYVAFDGVTISGK